MARKFLSYQNILQMDISTSLPRELHNFFTLQVSKCGEPGTGEGSLEQFHIDSLCLLNYKKSSTSDISCIVASQNIMHNNIIYFRKREAIFSRDDIKYITSVYKMLYPDIVIDHIPMIYEQFNELKVFNEIFTSKRSKGNHSSIICAFWHSSIIVPSLLIIKISIKAQPVLYHSLIMANTLVTK